jgi:hypothetical protein
MTTDPVISNYPFVPFGDLSYCFTRNILYQTDMSKPVEYGKQYFENYVEREDTEIANRLNEHRTQLAATYCNCVLDIGIGSGEFIRKSKIKTYGYDINPYGVEWLQERGLFVDPYKEIPEEIDGITLWDTLEHMKEPSTFLSALGQRTVIVSLPIFSDLFKIRQSKHYKPGEHFYYYTAEGIRDLFRHNGFHLLEISDGETLAGREDILTFVFKRFNCGDTCEH